MFNIAKITFQIDKDFVNQYKDKQPKWGYNGLGYMVYKRTYARPLTEDPAGPSEEFYQTIERVVNGIFSYQKNHCKANFLPWSEDKAQRTAKKMFQSMWEFKFLPPGRGLWSIGTSHIERHGGASANNCFSWETKILTSEGVKSIGSLLNQNPVIMTTNGKWIKAPIKSFGKQRIYELTIRRSGIDKVIRTTSDHRWFVQDKRKTYRDDGFREVLTKDLKPEVHRLQYCFGQGIKEINPSYYGITHGITYGDGSMPYEIEGSSAFIILCGDKNKELIKYFIPNQITESDNGIRIGGLPRFYKSFPSINESKSYLYGFLAGYFAADGTVSEDGSPSISTCDHESALKFRDLCYKVGIGTYGIRSENRISNLTNQESTIYKIVLMRDTLHDDFFLIKNHKERFLSNKNIHKQYWHVVSVQETDNFEDVYCAVVDGYGKFVLEDNILTGNCAFISTQNIDKEGAKPFEFLMDMLMLGVGVGFDTLGAGKALVFEPDPDVRVIQIPDTREGWTDSVKSLIHSYLTSSRTYKFDYTLIRPKGLPIKGFGGVSSGPEPLIELHNSIRSILDNRSGQNITSTDIVDICNLIGKCVVSGNVRRSAELALGSALDKEFINLKQDKEKLMSHRWASNNSVTCEPGMDYTELAELTATNGEPGYIWLENSRQFGRIKDGKRNADPLIMGYNPCAEQSLESYELCTLCETFPANHNSLAEYLDTLKLAYLYAKTVTLLPTHVPETNAVMMRNRRIGCSQSGIINAFAKHGRKTMLDWCDKSYEYLKGLDTQYSSWLCIPKSIKITTVKPSGTVSLLAGQSPGIHYPHSKFYIRRVRLASNSSMIPVLKNAGYHIENCVYSSDTSVVSFPIKEEYFYRGKEEVPLFEQVANAVAYQTVWSDNAVSITATFAPNEKPHIATLLSLYDEHLKSISFLPLESHGYKQPPYETITEEVYNQMVAPITPIASFNVQQDNKSALMYCDGDKCTIS